MKNSWFLTPRPVSQPALQLFCFPYAGGNSTTFTGWEQSFPANVELVLVQPPGRHSRLFEYPYDTMHELIEVMHQHFLKALKSKFVLFGHSLGSYVAFELMQQLSISNGPVPEHFIASASRSPYPDFSKDSAYDLPYDEFVDYLRKLGGTPDGVLQNKELLELYLPTLRADFKIADTYSVSDDRLFDIPVSVLNGDKDDMITEESLQDWGRYFTSKPDRLTIAGGHFYLEEQKHEVLIYLKKIVRRYMSSGVC
jgi:surfactin synthase thioesterase subunit